eukprot:TRINITY_DN10046_c0_g1_i3.p2 TRINITY_DN10046_c0_g1~~TRINITY_DN10046_c0_g1_i3.p2  ORF type:complete len:120 (-),score=17.70 TRINITY_DN10046_c0_g1_i3:54-413(-)
MHSKDNLRRSREGVNAGLNSIERLFIELNTNRNESKITAEANVQTDSEIIVASGANSEVEINKLKETLVSSGKSKFLTESLSITHFKPLNIQDKLGRRLAPEEIYRAICLLYTSPSPRD